MHTPTFGKRSSALPPQMPRALRVAVVTETWPPEINGVAATIARVVDGLRRLGHEVQLVRPHQGDGERGDGHPGATIEGGVEVLTRGLPIPRYPQLRMGLPSRRTLQRLWSQRPPDVVHLVTEGPLGRSALQAARQLGLPVVSDFRTNFHAYSGHYGLAWLRRPIVGYLRRFHNRTAVTMVPTEALRADLTAAGFERLRVVSRGVDATLFNPVRRDDALRARWGAAAHAPVALCVGRLAPEKNLGTLLVAFAALRRVAPAARLVLVGDGPQRAALQRACPEAVFAGTRRGDDLAAHYASADLFLFPSLTETFGNVVPEAMASGLPVIGHDLAAAAQLIRHGDNGLLVGCGDVAAFAAAACLLAANPERARAMGRHARGTALGLDWGRIVAAVETEYRTAMAGHGAQRPATWAQALPTG